MQKVVVIVAHPDDEVLGAGGSTARHVEEGDRVSILVLGEGVASRTGKNPTEVKREQKQLNADARKAHKLLGVHENIFKAFPDNAFDTVPLLSIVHEIESVLRAVKPDVIYTHHGNDTNVDHRIVREATDAAVRPMFGARLFEVRAFEVPSSTEWNFTRDPFWPNVFVALSERSEDISAPALAGISRITRTHSRRAVGVSSCRSVRTRLCSPIA
jgi:LmbE family N-acetylglucosaminyl deacetylase